MNYNLAASVWAQIWQSFKRNSVNSAYLFVGRWLTYGMSIGTVLLFAHLTTPQVYGQFTFLSGLFDIFVIVTFPGLGSALIQSVSKGFNGTLKLVAMKRFKGGVVGSFLLMGCAVYYGMTRQNVNLAIGAAVAALIFPFYYAFINYESYLLGKQEFKTYAYYTAVSGLIGSATVMISVFLTHGFVVPFTSKIILGCGIALLFYLRESRLSGEKVDGSAIKYGMQLTALNVISILSNKIEVLVIPVFFSFDSLAFFYIGERVASEFKFSWAVISNQMLPRLSQCNTADAYRKANSKLFPVLVVYTAIALSLAVVVPLVFKMLLTTKFMPAVDLTRMMLIASILSLTGAYYETYMVSQKLIRELSILRFVFPTAYLSALPIFAWKFNVIGIVYAKMLAGIVYSIFAVSLSWRERRGK